MEEIEIKPGEEIFFIYPVGFMPGFVISAEKLQEIKQKMAETEENKNDEPPKPPRGGKTIGRIALEGNF